MKSQLRWSKPPTSFAILAATATAAYVTVSAGFTKAVMFADADCTITAKFGVVNADPGAVPTPAAPGNTNAGQFLRKCFAGEEFVLETGSSTEMWGSDGGGVATVLNIKQSSGGTVNFYGEAGVE